MNEQNFCCTFLCSTKTDKNNRTVAKVQTSAQIDINELFIKFCYG